MNKKQNIKAPGHSPECEGEPYYYDGALGYEAMKCDVCGYELDLNAEANARATAERLAAKAQHSPLPDRRKTDPIRQIIDYCQKQSEYSSDEAILWAQCKSFAIRARERYEQSVNNAEKLAEALRKLKYADDHGLDLTPSIDGALAALAQWHPCAMGTIGAGSPPTHTPNGFDPRWVAAINVALADRENGTPPIADITEEMWDRFLGPMLDAIEDGEV